MYCNQDCQKLHWFNHKKICKKLQEQRQKHEAESAKRIEKQAKGILCLRLLIWSFDLTTSQQSFSSTFLCCHIIKIYEKHVTPVQVQAIIMMLTWTSILSRI